MLKLFFTILFISTSSFLFGQASSYSSTNLSKAPFDIDRDVLDSWQTVVAPGISPNGDYVFYTINNYPARANTLVVCSADKKRVREFINAKGATFSYDNKLCVFQVEDSLFFLHLETFKVEYIGEVSMLQIIQDNNSIWLGYQPKEMPGKLILHNLNTGGKHIYDGIHGYSFSSSLQTVLIQKKEPNGLRWLNLNTEDSLLDIWSDSNSVIEKYVFHESGKEIAFMVYNKTKPEEGCSIWYYQAGMPKAVKLVTNDSAGTDSLIINNSDLGFSRDGNYLFFKLKRHSEFYKPNKDGVPVDIWDYRDLLLQCEQLANVVDSRVQNDFLAVINVKGGRVIRLEQAGEENRIPTSQLASDFTIVEDGRNKFWWQKDKGTTWYLVSLMDGSRTLLARNGHIDPSISSSPDGNYLVYFDLKQNSYFSYDISSKTIHQISTCIKERLDNEFYAALTGITFSGPVGIAGWLENDVAVFIYDNYDIWQLDPSGKLPPINITKGYGRKHNIKLRFVYGYEDLKKPINTKQPILLTGFNTVTKYNGFFHCFPDSNSDPEKLTMGPYRYYRVHTQVPKNGEAFSQGVQPVRAANAKKWLVQRESPTEAPNYFWTFDFRNYQPITALQPQKKYNWLTTELIHWKQLDGTLTQGVLYKPENFDAHKKYPVIFNYYEKLSFRMYEFPSPFFAIGRIDIPWYVSRGYLVFTPDIHHSYATKSGKVAGEAVVNSIVSAAKYLAQRPYVDVAKMGIQGHSFGGGETLYLLTHSNLFAAACAAASTVSDQISAYLGLNYVNGKPRSDFRLDNSERGHDKIGATLWERPDLYIKSSPVFNANKVTTPLLLMHNQRDGSVNWNQSVEMYLALRRLEKKVWMLQYDRGTHVLRNYDDARDFTLRMSQFFDHYLKDYPAPFWMTKGIPATMKGIETGYDLDPAGNCGLKENNCKVCNRWNVQMERTPEMFSKPISEWHLDKSLENSQKQKSKPATKACR